MKRQQITLHRHQQGTEQWEKAREGKFTGSNAYKLLGSFGASEYAKAIASSFGGNFHTKRGHILEDEAIELYEGIHGINVDRPGWVTNSHFPTCLYSPDGLTDEFVLEVKCFVEAKHMKMYNGEVDIKVLAQIHFGMMISGKRKAKLIIYNPELDAEFAYKEIPIRYRSTITTNFKRILQPKKEGIT